MCVWNMGIRWVSVRKKRANVYRQSIHVDFEKSSAFGLKSKSISVWRTLQKTSEIEKKIDNNDEMVS